MIAPNWLGDAVMALPALSDLRRGQPDASISVAARPSVAPLFTLVRDVDEVITLRDDQPWPLAGREVALLLPNSFHSALMLARARIPERWGYRTDWRGLLLTRAVPRPSSSLHQVEYYQQLVRALGFPSGAAAPRLPVTSDLRDSGALHLAAALGVNVTAVFGPTNERLTAPVAGEQWPVAGGSEITDHRPPTTDHRPPSTGHRPPLVTVLTHAVWCRPCQLRDCPLDHACMHGIGVPSVLDATRRML